MAEKQKKVKVRRTKVYAEVRDRVERRGRNRIINGERYRGHSLSQEDVNQKLEEWNKTGKFVSPYTSGIRSDHLMTLVELGVNKAWHLGRDVKPVLRRIMMAAKDRRFKNRWVRFENNERGKQPSDVTDRMYDNYKSFRRLCMDTKGRVGVTGENPYGMRLWQIGCCVDIFTLRKEIEVGEEKVVSLERYVRLNTHSRMPISKTIKSLGEIEQEYAVDLSGETMGPG